MIYLNNVIIWTAWKLSGNLAWFFNRSVLRSAWYAMRDKTPNE